MAATAAAWIRRLSRDHQSSSNSHSEQDEASDTVEERHQVGKRFSAISISNNSTSAVHPHQQTHVNKHGPPPSSSRSRTFLAGLVNSSKRRFSLPVISPLIKQFIYILNVQVNDGDRQMDEEELVHGIQSARYSADQGRPKGRNGSADFLEV